MKMPGISALQEFSFDRLVNDFKQLDPNDPGVWPLAPKALILFLILAATVALGWWLDWKGKNEQLEQGQKEEQKLRDDWLVKKKQAINLDEYKKQLAEMDRQFGALLRQLPNKSEMESLLVVVNQAGKGRGLQFELWKPGQETLKEFFAELPIAVSITGSYHDLGLFVSDVAKLPRIVTLRDVNLVTSKDGNGLDFSATAVAYRYLDEEEVSKQKREKAAAQQKQKK